MSEKQFNYWCKFLDELPKGVPASKHLKYIIRSQEYKNLTLEGKLELQTLILGYIKAVG